MLSGGLRLLLFKQVHVEIACDDLENDPDLRAGILSGEGRSFCVDTDVKWVMSPDAEGFEDRLDSGWPGTQPRDTFWRRA